MSESLAADAPRSGAKPAMVTVAGLPTSRGFASGPVFLYRGDGDLAVPEYEVPQDRVLAEVARYHAARAETRRQLEALVEKFKSVGGKEETNVFSNHLDIFDDKLIVSAIERNIAERRLNVESAIRQAVDEFRTVFGKMRDPYLRERLRDIDDLERRILCVLMDRTETAFSQITEPTIIVAEDLTPSDTVTLPREFVLGFATNRGSTTSHVALLARALGIPSVVGLGDITSRVHAGDLVLLDGTNGAVTVNPDEETREEFARMAVRERELLAFLSDDGSRCPAAEQIPRLEVKLLANAQPGVPLSGLSDQGAEGIGLYRSEYLWLSEEDEPTEERQHAVYAEAARAAASMGSGARTVFRVLDLGGDKLQRGRKTGEANPFLGNRSIRWLLSHRDTFRRQLRAILRASAEGPSAVMYPMVSTVQELREANAELLRAMEDLRAEGVAFDERIPHGVMIEVPSAALNAEAFARECDFFSIGTNDLVQYTLAADRGNECVSHLYQPSNPAVIRLVDMTVRAAEAAGIPVAVCGESASDPVLAVLWTGLGVSELSMSGRYIPVIRKTLRVVTVPRARELARRVRELGASRTAAEIYEFCRGFVREAMPELEDIRSFFTVG